MTARADARGHRIYYDKKLRCWVYEKDGKKISGNEACRHCGRKPILVKVKIPSDLSSTGKVKWKRVLIDACIAPMVEALQKGGIDMRGSCCSHGKGHGEINLQDSRILRVIPKGRCDEKNCSSG